MIKKHPKAELLNAFVNADLPLGLSLIVAAHVEMCPSCRTKVDLMTDFAALRAFHQNEEQTQFGDMANQIMNDTSAPAERIKPQPKIITTQQADLQLPRALRSLPINDWFRLGKVSRATVDINEDNIHCHILKIDAGGEVPAHTHKGYEVTLLLDGYFEDEMGRYERGDFIWLDAEHTHKPVSVDGCVCLTVANDALHFTQGMSRLLNPIGKLIY